MKKPVSSVVERLLSGDRRALARVISHIESGTPDLTRILAEIYTHTGHAFSVGFTGPPGAGKSTILTHLIKQYRGEGLKIGVISVDPSSPFTQGAILGDRIRLADHFLDPGVFIRSMSSRGHLGGLAVTSKLTALAMEAYGVDIVLYETVGVGQGEVEISSAADTVVLVLQPGAGDAVQALKAGVMEVADIFCVNKADHPRARSTAVQVRSVLEIGQELDPRPWTPPILMSRGDTGEGIKELQEAISRHQSYLKESGELELRRRESLKSAVISRVSAKVEEGIKDRLSREDSELLDQVYTRKLDPVSAAEMLLKKL